MSFRTILNIGALFSLGAMSVLHSVVPQSGPAGRRLRLDAITPRAMAATGTLPARDTRGIRDGCETFISMSQPEPSTTADSVYIAVQYGELITSPAACLSSGPPDSFTLAVNGNSVTNVSYSYTSKGSGYTTARAMVPLARNTINLIVATTNGHDGSSTPRTDVASASVEQIHENVYQVSITAPGGTTQLMTGQQQSILFTVTNTSDAVDTFDLTCGTTDVLDCLEVSPRRVTLGIGQAVGAVARVVARASQGTSALTVNASGRASASASQPIYVQAQSADVALANPGTLVEKSACLELSVVVGVATECGVLRVAHPLPTVMTLGKSRTPVLVYYADQADGTEVIAVNVTPPGPGAPDAVRAVLSTDASVGVSDDKQWTGAMQPGVTSRVALLFGSSTLQTGVYPYTVSVYFRTNGQWSAPMQASSSIVHVNRAQSAFGAGWTLAGLERLLDAPNNGKLWIAGDGSARLYARNASAPGPLVHYNAEAYDRPDSLLYDPARAVYTRYAEQGLKVEFNDQGLHVATESRRGHRTEFAYETGAAGQRLRTISVPTLATPLTYTFLYDGAGHLDSVVAPGAGQVTRLRPRALAGQPNVAVVDSIIDPDTTAVTFRYASSTSPLMQGQLDRRGTLTEWTYETPHTVAEATTTLSEVGQPTVSVRTTLRHAQSAGSGTSLLLAADVVSSIQSPRTDTVVVTTFWLDRFGAPRKMRNALGDTVLLHQAPTFPGLVAATRQPNGLTSRAYFDSRGNVDSTLTVNPLGDARDAVTRYVWDAKWNAPTRVTTPEGVVTDFDYDASNGNRLWQQTGGPSHRVTFGYDPAAKFLASFTRLPSGAQHEYGYDSLGNLRSARTPRGFVTLSFRDGVGRDTLIVSPVDTLGVHFLRTRTQYDVMNRPRLVVTAGEAMPGVGAETTFVRADFDASGNTLAVSRSGVPDVTNIGTSTSRWRYDRLNRRVAEIATDGAVDSTTYDGNGNAVNTMDRRGYSSTAQFDALDRLRARIKPLVVYKDTVMSGWTFPLYPNCQTTKLCFAADTARFTYDVMGNLLTADNQDAQIRRTYTQSGIVTTDSLRVRTWTNPQGGADFQTHQYGLTFGYDLDGRRVWMRVPRQLGAKVSGMPGTVYDSIAYAYDAATGAVSGARDILGNSFTITRDDDGRLTRILYPQGNFKQYTYNADGEPTNVREDLTATGSGTNDIVTVYDARGKALISQAESGWIPDTNSYSGLGTLVAHHRVRPYFSPREYHDTWTADALANVSNVFSSNSYYYYATGGQRYVESTSSTWNTYAPGTGRLTAVAVQAGSGNRPLSGLGCTTSSSAETHRAQQFDAAGNLATFSANWLVLSGGGTSSCPSSPPDEAHVAGARYYDADGRLRVADNRAADNSPEKLPGDPEGYEEYRYDALGRRVLRRARATPPRSPGGPSVDLIQRFVWDGNDIVAETQYPGSNGVSAADLERDTTDLVGDATFFGRVIYLAGHIIDQPLSVVRIGYQKSVGGQSKSWEPVAFVPQWNLRGRAVGALFVGPTGRCQTVGSTTGCVDPTFPDRENYGSVVGPKYPQYAYNGWFGSLVQDQVDGTGQLYRRNRYYDPVTGRFTQEDPIGLAGGMNVYGFASGDPVNYSDPFGLKPGPWESFKTWFLDSWSGRAAGTGPAHFGEVMRGAADLFSAGDGGLMMGPAAEIATVSVSRSKYPQSAAHIEDAQAAGQPSVVTVDRGGASARRAAALKGTATRAGLDRDEYPPAMFREGGAGSSVRYVNPSDNRGAGACMGAQCRTLPDATQVQIKVVP
jgi:RHS repeat-associated protein